MIVLELETVQLEMRKVQTQYEILCDKMEQIVKDYKAFNAEIKTLEAKVCLKKIDANQLAEIRAKNIMDVEDLPECVDQMDGNVKKPRTTDF